MLSNVFIVLAACSFGNSSLCIRQGEIEPPSVAVARAEYRPGGPFFSLPEMSASEAFWLKFRECGGSPPQGAEDVARAREAGSRVEYIHQGSFGVVVEWYVADRIGVRQGFTVPVRPVCRRERSNLQLTLAYPLSFDGEAVGATSAIFENPRGVRVRYSGLAAWDVRGTSLPARLAIEPGCLRIEVQDENAEYPVTIDPLIVVEQASFTGSDTAPSDFFGSAVQMEGDTVVVGAARDDDLGNASGSAYVFECVNGSWIEQGKLHASDGSSQDLFGTSLALQSDTLMVGAPNAANFVGWTTGAVYVFSRSGSTFTEVQKIDDSGGSDFGIALALDGDTLVVGQTSENANVYTRTAGTWSYHQKITATPGQYGEWFGQVVAVHQDRLAVGAIRQNSRGAVYLFERSGGAWVQVKRLVAPDGSLGDDFGSSIALDADRVFVGARGDDDVGPDTGSVYVFELSGSSWVATHKLLSGTGAEVGDYLALTDPLLVSGGQGGLSMYAESSSGWSSVADVVYASDLFGIGHLAAHGNRVASSSIVFQEVRVYGLETSASYCTGKTNSVGCAPFMRTSGVASSTLLAPFWVVGEGAKPGEGGFLLYGFKKANLAFHGGKLCVKPPFNRTPVTQAKSVGIGCSGSVLRSDFNKRVQGGGDPLLSVGQSVLAQWFQRDPLDAFGDGLSDAVQFIICP